MFMNRVGTVNTHPALYPKKVQVMATMAHHEGSSPICVRAMVSSPAATRSAEEMKTGLRGKRLRKTAAKRPPGILIRDTRKLSRYESRFRSVDWKKKSFSVQFTENTNQSRHKD